MLNKLILCAALTLAAPLARADGKHKMKPGNYHIVVTHEIVGMPVKMPATNLEKCITPEDADNREKLTHHNDKCEQTQFKSAGDKLSFSVVCHEHGGTQTGNGEFTFGSDQYSGVITIEMTNPSDGKPMKVINHLSSTRTGDCAK